MKQQGFKVTTIVTGLLVITAGVLWILFNADVLDPAYKPIVFSWQMLLVALGFNGLFSRNGWGFSAILMVVGSFFLIKKIDIPSLTVITQNFWAIALVLLGLIILIRSIFGRRSFIYCSSDMNKGNWKNFGKCKGEAGYIELNNVFSGTEKKLDIENFKGGEINCIFGGVELDLSDCRLAEGTYILEINSVFGGSVIYVPRDWNIEVRQDQVFGNFEDRRPKNSLEVDKSKTLIVKASSVFGGGELKYKN